MWQLLLPKILVVPLRNRNPKLPDRPLTVSIVQPSLLDPSATVEEAKIDAARPVESVDRSDERVRPQRLGDYVG